MVEQHMPVCVFDLDHTLTCGNAKQAIDACLERGFDLAINTARPSPWLDKKLHHLGLPSTSSPAFVYNPHSYSQTTSERALAKAAGMVHLAKHFGTDQLVLFDDLPANVEAVQAAGFLGQVVGSEDCGISTGDLAILNELERPGEYRVNHTAAAAVSGPPALYHSSSSQLRHGHRPLAAPR